MRLLGKAAATAFKEGHADARTAIDTWMALVEAAEWKNPHEMKQRFPKADVIGDRNIVFNICRNDYRIWVTINYKHQVAVIKAIGTHKEYDKWEIK